MKWSIRCWLALWAMLFVAAAQVATAPFTPVDVNIDLSLRNHAACTLDEGWQVQPHPDNPALIRVTDTGTPASLATPLLSAGQAYLLKLKLKFHDHDQRINVSLNGRPITTVQPTRVHRAEKFMVMVPPGLVHDGNNRVGFANHGAAGRTEYEQVRFINFLVPLSERHQAYVALWSPSPVRAVGKHLVGWLAQWLIVWGLAMFVVMACGPAVVPMASFWVSAVVWALIAWLPQVTLYRLACPRGFFWVTGFLWFGVGCLVAATLRLIRRVWGEMPTATKTVRQIVQGRAFHRAAVPAIRAFIRHFAQWSQGTMHTAAASVKTSTTVVWRVAQRAATLLTRGPVGAVLACLSRSKVAVVLLAIIFYGFILRYNFHHSKMDEEWNYLGTTTDSVLMFDAAARVLKTGTFTQFDGTYARVTGLAGYGLALAAMATGGLYPGYAWLRWWLLIFGSLIPLIGFLVIRVASGSAVGGLAVAAVLASEPLLVSESRTIYHDVPTTLCAGIALYWLYRVLREERVAPRPAILLGLSAGLTILAKMSHLCLMAVIVGSAGLRRWTLPRWKNIGIAFLTATVVLGVWMGRNARVLGMPILSSQSGLVFAASTGQAVWKPPGAGGEIATVGQEQRFNQSYVQQALAWIRVHPREYARIAAKKVRAFWLEGPSPWQQTLLWMLVASLLVTFTWEQRLLLKMLPIGMYLVLYSITFGFTWPALPTYYPPFLFLLILAAAPLFIGTVGRLWQLVRWMARALEFPSVLLEVAAMVGCCAVGVLVWQPQVDWRAFRRYQQQAVEEQRYLAWAGTVLPDNAVIVKTDRGNPWDAQRYTHRPVFFNVLYGIPWVIYKTPYTAQDYSRDWQSVSFNPTSFRFDLPRDHGPIDAAAYLPPEDLATFRQEGMRGFLSIWQQRGRELFVLDVDAKVLAESFLPANAYALRGKELTLKFYRAFPENPHRAVYRLVRHDDPHLGQFRTGSEQAVVWTTAPCPARKPTTVWFSGAFGPAPGLAKLLVNGTYAMSFALGADGNRVWTENGYRLEFTMHHPWWEIRTGPKYTSGTFALTIPAQAITPGRPLTLSVSPLLVTGEPESWFGLLNTTDTFTMMAHNGKTAALAADVQHLEGFDELLGTADMMRLMDEGRAGPVEIWLARAQASRL